MIKLYWTKTLFHIDPVRIGIFCCLGFCLAFPACNKTEQPSTGDNAATPRMTATPAKAVNFRAEITGSANAKIEGPGVVTYIPARNDNPGYFFIADDTGIRPWGLTITIPANKGTGTFDLVSGGPFDAGNIFDIRVDQDLGKSTLSFDRNTKGELVLEGFPESHETVSGVEVKGNFKFTTQDASGGELNVTGDFGFIGK